MSLFSELRRRNVFKVAFVYVVGAALLFWIAALVANKSGLVWWTSWAVGILLIVGFPAALIFAWVYEFTPSGLKKAVDVDQTQSIVFKTGQKLNAALAVVVVLAAVAMIADRLLPEFHVVQALPPPPPSLIMPSKVTTPDGIASFALDNGLKVIVWPDADIPNVVMYNFVRAGGRNEVPGITGLSHFFEHMMFNGTSRRAPGEFDRTMEAAGGANNAYTSNDVTVYQDWFPKTAIDTIFDLEGDRLSNLKIDPEVVESERGVVYSERRTRIDNDNWGRLYEQMLATAFIAHPYRLPVIGWPADIEAWTQEDLETYYRRYYAPNNSLMVFTGDVTVEEIRGYAVQYLAGAPAQEPPAPVRTVEPEQLGTRRLTLEVPAQTPLLHVAFHTGATTDPDTLPLALLLNILVNGDSSRLHQQLVETEQSAIDIGGFQYESFDPLLVYFYLTLPPGGDPAAVEASFMAALQRVAQEGISEAELAKARNIMLANFYRNLSTINGKAAAIGEYEVFHGDYEKLFEYPAAVEAVTGEQIQAVAAKVFRPGNATIGTLVPGQEASE